MAHKQKHTPEQGLITIISVVFLIVSLAIVLSPKQIQIDRGPKASENLAALAMMQLQENEIVLGDLSGNNVIEPKDVVLLKSLLSNQEFSARQRLASDLDNSNSITNRDLLILNAVLEGRVEKLPVIKGDITGEGTVDSDDLLLLAEYLEGFSSLSMDQFFRADINMDGRVNQKDKEELIKIIQ